MLVGSHKHSECQKFKDAYIYTVMSDQTNKATFSSTHSLGKNLIRCKTEYLDHDEDETNNLGIDRPDLGIFDTRAWDHMYEKWVDSDGPFPGKHPDP